LAAALVVASLSLAACGGGSSSSGSAGGSTNALVQLQPDSAGGSLLVNQQGMTLYTLSAEKDGNLICKAGAMVPGGSASCLSVWKPLLAPGGKASGVQGLGTLRRSDGQGVQATYNGLPLYTFTGDKAPGDTAGNGFRDVGVWHVAETGSSAPAASSSGGSGGYGY
jgi:predicted lipoprotein with Yx(FWY)xxD motif